MYFPIFIYHQFVCFFFIRWLIGRIYLNKSDISSNVSAADVKVHETVPEAAMCLVKM